MTHSDTSRQRTGQYWISRIRQLPLSGKVRILNVCGGHERTISGAGLRAALPDNIELIPGPGCPVCICPEEDIYDAIHLALNHEIILVAFGDMLRVPINAPRNEVRSLEQARTAGADVRAIASPTDAVNIANQNPDKRVVFFACGFETTMAPVAAMVAQGLPDNLLLLLSGRLTWPAVAMLLASEQAGFDALVAPGHVATVMGPEEWSFVPQQYHLPTAVAGFTPDHLLAALYSVLHQQLEHQPALDNCYPEAVRPGGNAIARKYLSQVMDVVDANWRGIGIISASGFALKSRYAAHDARSLIPHETNLIRKHAGQMPPGCDCTHVVLGKIYPVDCALYGRTCAPRHPIGPCMVSDEGACRVWWATGHRQSKHSHA